FELLIRNNKALEINTSGLFMDMKDTLPNISYVKRFKALGGKYITVGSDSHYADKVLRGISTGYSLARAAGFDSITIFREHNPILIKI
ncbi:MAG: histidinol phosphate phosphatase, partial [Eubacterium sp.]|nr:histidinol phosphate phosphatase [Eubacterium sp.]